ncbi:MAG: right-handed parallel beta-helix repeat-containing protein [Planctomycetota bacterium]
MPEFYVSKDGCDQWSGRLPEPNAGGDDGPLRTLEAAQRAVRQEKKNLSRRRGIKVYLRGGTYHLDRPLRFAAEDSGFGRDPDSWPKWAKTWPVVWQAYEDEDPVLSGGRPIEGPWEEETVNGCRAWTVELPRVERGEWNFAQLWVNGERRRRARFPKSGVKQVQRAINADFDGHGHTTESYKFGYDEGDLNGDWYNLQDVELHFFGWWLDKWVKIKEVDEQRRIATFDRDAHLRMAWAPGDGIDYVVENVFEALTDPGEWYLDRSKGKLYYLPYPQEDMGSAEIVAPARSTLLIVDGADNIRIEGITFAHNEWNLPQDFAGAKQAAIHVPGAVQIRNSDECVFSSCRFVHLGSYGAEVKDNTVEARFEGCTFDDLGAGGVKIWHGCRRNAVLNCEIGNGGQVFSSAVGVLIGQSSGNRVEHCHIHDLYYTGISVGWNWGYDESNGYGNIIEWNHIHDIGKGLLSDMGGIYLLGHAPGTRLRYNVIHDITCRRYGGWCIYTDEGSTDVLIESNLCYRANKNAFNQHYGRNNRVVNNILAHGDDAVISYGRPEEHLGLVFEQNIFLSHHVPILRSVSPCRWTPQQTYFDRNLYWCESGAVRFQENEVALYGSQAFPDGYLAESDNFAPLPAMPDVEHEPGESDWERAVRYDEFVSENGNEAADAAAEARFLRQEGVLWVRGHFERPEAPARPEGVIWMREHMELLLTPANASDAVFQIGLASDGEVETVWHGCSRPSGYECGATVKDHGDAWTGYIKIPIDPLCESMGGENGTEWTFLLGFARPGTVLDFDGWKARGHEESGIVADPGFRDPQNGDFRLPDESPAYELGFVPFDFSQAGVNEESKDG